MKTMINSGTISEILESAAVSGYRKPKDDMAIDVWKAGADTHKPKSLKKGWSAVYVYVHGREVLKVGQCGGKSTYTCYVYRHYNTKHPSTLAKSILKDDELGQGLTAKNAAQWIKENTTRYNILLPPSYGKYFRSFVEGYLILKLKPKFERYGD